MPQVTNLGALFRQKLDQCNREQEQHTMNQTPTYFLEPWMHTYLFKLLDAYLLQLSKSRGEIISSANIQALFRMLVETNPTDGSQRINKVTAIKYLRTEVRFQSVQNLVPCLSTVNHALADAQATVAPAGIFQETVYFGLRESKDFVDHMIDVIRRV